MESLNGRTAFITGGASGIGLAIAEALLAAGSRVVLADRDAKSLEREVDRLGRDAIGHALDVSDRHAWDAARTAAESQFGPVDILVNNAGLAPDWNELIDMPFEHFDRIVEVMLTGTFNGIRTFGSSLRDRGGHIVNTASLSGLIAAPRLGAYTAAKFGVIGMSETLRAEMEPHGVGVSVLCPGSVRTNLNANDPVPSELQSTVHRVLEPADVAQLVVEAILANHLYVVTHAEFRGVVANRSEQLLAAFGRSHHSASAG